MAGSVILLWDSSWTDVLWLWHLPCRDLTNTHTEMSSNVNKQICRKDPITLPASWRTPGIHIFYHHREHRCHIPSHRASNVPQSHTHVNKNITFVGDVQFCVCVCVSALPSLISHSSDVQTLLQHVNDPPPCGSGERAMTYMFKCAEQKSYIVLEWMSAWVMPLNLNTFCWLWWGAYTRLNVCALCILFERQIPGCQNWTDAVLSCLCGKSHE